MRKKIFNKKENFLKSFKIKIKKINKNNNNNINNNNYQKDTKQDNIIINFV